MANRVAWNKGLKGIHFSPATEFKPRLNIPKVELEELYLKKRLTLAEIASHYGCSESGLWKWLKKYGVPPRPRGTRPEVKEKWRQAISIALKGHPNWFRGHTEETKKKIAEAMKDEKNPQYGKPRSEEHRRKLSESNKGKILSEEHKSKISLALKGENNPNFGKALPFEQRTKISEAVKKYMTTEKGKEQARKGGALGHKACWKRPTSAESKLLSILESVDAGSWQYVGDGSFTVGYKNPDFLNINGKKAVIELFGDYWHRGENECDRIQHYARYGFKCLVTWEHELEDKENLSNKLMKFIEEVN
jgi:transposase-like protein